MADEVRRVDRTLVAKGHIFDYYHDTMEFANGDTAEWDYIHHNGAAAGVAVLDDGRLLMVSQFRNALDRMTLEIPAGGLKTPEEPTMTAAVREVEEETGYRAGNAKLLLTIRTTVAFCNEKIDIYLCTGLTKTKQNLDPDEYVNVKAYTVSELKEMIYAGIIQDSKTICAILAYDDCLQKKRDN